MTAPSNDAALNQMEQSNFTISGGPSRNTIPERSKTITTEHKKQRLRTELNLIQSIDRIT
jgi:hypothetical protein